MNIAQSVVELHKIQERIDKLVIRRKELIAERDFYTEKFEMGEIGQILYSMRMTPIYFESGLIKADYVKEVKRFNDMETEYRLLKCFESEETEEEI
jgi:hypothetical protein